MEYMRVFMVLLAMTAGSTTGAGVQEDGGGEEPPEGCVQIDENLWDCPDGVCYMINGMWVCD